MSDDWPDLIKQVRAKYGLAQVQLAEMVGVSQKTISRWERGESLPARPAQTQMIDLLRKPSGDLIGGLAKSIQHCPAPRALSRMPNLRLLALSPPALQKRPSIAGWLDRELARIACGILEEMLDDGPLQRAIALQDVACVVSTTDSVLRTAEHAKIGKFRTTISYFSHDGVVYSDAVSVPAPASAVRGYRAVMIDGLT